MVIFPNGDWFTRRVHVVSYRNSVNTFEKLTLLPKLLLQTQWKRSGKSKVSKRGGVGSSGHKTVADGDDGSGSGRRVRPATSWTHLFGHIVGKPIVIDTTTTKTTKTTAISLTSSTTSTARADGKPVPSTLLSSLGATVAHLVRTPSIPPIAYHRIIH
jgi:hypothetical protein